MTIWEQETGVLKPSHQYCCWLLAFTAKQVCKIVNKVCK
jgi:hypothetical protein